MHDVFRLVFDLDTLTATSKKELCKGCPFIWFSSRIIVEIEHLVPVRIMSIFQDQLLGILINWWLFLNTLGRSDHWQVDHSASRSYSKDLIQSIKYHYNVAIYKIREGEHSIAPKTTSANAASASP